MTPGLLDPAVGGLEPPIWQLNARGVAVYTDGVELTGDFDDDGRGDIVWQHEDGSIAVWRMNGMALLGAQRFHPGQPSDNQWRLVAANDFDRDGRPDLLWQFTDGSVVLWFMNGTEFGAARPLTPARPGDPRWRVAATGDFNGDSRPDLVWQHEDGSIGVWFMNRAEAVGMQPFEPARPSDPAWRIAGAGDFNCDGHSDLLWQHLDGSLAVWFMDGARLVEGIELNPAHPGDPGWRVAGVADFDRDSYPDVLWQHTQGAIGVWLMEGVRLAHAGFTEPAGPGDARWRIAGPK
jgi:hypothetical protein